MILYHNPRCSKSRQALALCQERGVPLEVVEYLKTGLDPATVERLAKSVEGGAEAIIRIADVRKAGLEPSLALLVEEPRYLQRPILEDGEKAVVGRPTEALLELLDEEKL